MVSIEIMGENIVNMATEMIFRRNTEVMEAGQELATLAALGSLLELLKSELEVIDLLSTILEGRPSSEPRLHIFPISGLGGMPFVSKVQDTPRLSRHSRLGISLGLAFDAVARLDQPKLSFGTAMYQCLNFL